MVRPFIFCNKEGIPGTHMVLGTGTCILYGDLLHMTSHMYIKKYIRKELVPGTCIYVHTYICM